VDPLYLSWKMKELNYSARFIELASEINTNMPRYVVSRVMEALNDRGILLKGSKILILGVAYKPDIDDIRESPGLDIIGLLDKKGAHVSYHDPYIPTVDAQDGQLHLSSVPDLMAAVREADAVVIVTNHRVYDFEAIHEAARFIFDSRNALGKRGQMSSKVARL
jgi:UDP-N-acetyl-D-glucosamine dehydrogenase